MQLPVFLGKFRRITSNNSYLPEIDGIRFFSILLVILFHFYGYFHARFDSGILEKADAYNWLTIFLLHGNRGVQLFFVLSGFILCLPFCEHFLNGKKRVDLKRYFLRRLTRLEPPYIISMVGIFVALIFFNGDSFSQLFPSLLASLVYLHGPIFNAAPRVSVVAWSLEVEIQFYLIAPLLFQVFRISPIIRRGILVLATFIFILVQHFFLRSDLTLVSHIQYFFVGILLADLYVSKVWVSFFQKHFISIMVLAIATLAGVMPLKGVLIAQLVFPALVFFLFYAILINPILKKVFSYSFIPIIGGMCYSIYLLHYPVISLIGRMSKYLKVTNYFLPNLLIQAALIIVPVLLVGGIFYYFIERPFMSNRWTNMLMGNKRKSSIRSASFENAYDGGELGSGDNDI